MRRSLPCSTSRQAVWPSFLVQVATASPFVFVFQIRKNQASGLSEEVFQLQLEIERKQLVEPDGVLDFSHSRVRIRLTLSIRRNTIKLVLEF